MTDLLASRQQAITLLEKLPSDRLAQVVALLETLSQHQPSPQSASQSDRSGNLQETSLLDVIYRRLPGEEQARFNQLRQRHEAGTITEAERQDYLALIDRIESQDAERAEALLRLAQVRNVDLSIVLAEFLPLQQSA